MKIDPYYQRRKCSAVILVLEDDYKGYADIRGDSLDMGHQMRAVSSKL